MVWKRILAAVTVILIVAAIVLLRKKGKHVQMNKPSQELKQ